MKTNVDAWYGYGDVFLANAKKVKFLGCVDYQADRIRKKGRGDCWIPIEVLVAVGDGVSPNDAVKGLQNAINEIKARAKRKRRSPDRPRVRYLAPGEKPREQRPAITKT
jgi:hypothetical protein